MVSSYPLLSQSIKRLLCDKIGLRSLAERPRRCVRSAPEAGESPARTPITRLGDPPFHVLTHPDDVRVSKEPSKDGFLSTEKSPRWILREGSENSIMDSTSEYHSAAGVSRQA